MPFQAKHALSYPKFLFVLLKHYWTKNALSGRKRQPATAGIAKDNQPQQASRTLLSLSTPYGLGLINQTEFIAKTYRRGICHGLLTSKITARS